MIVDGSVRDAAEIRELGSHSLRGESIKRSGTRKDRERSQSHLLRRRIVNPGDIIVGDDDGVVVVPREAGQSPERGSRRH